MPRNFQAKTVRLRMIAGGIVVLLNNPVGASPSHSITFSWAPNPEPNIAGYRIHYGVVTRNYTQVLDTGPATSATIINLMEGTTYYFALGAYNILGLESDLTSELAYLVPISPPALQIRVTPARQAVLTITGPTNRVFNIQASPDLKGWTNIGTVTLGASGSSTFTDTNAPTTLKRFYRARSAP